MMDISYIAGRNFKNRLKRKERKKDIKEYRSLMLCLATPASFPDSGYYYRLKERELEKIISRTIDKLPKLKQVLIVTTVHNECCKAANEYWKPRKELNGASAADMDAAIY